MFLYERRNADFGSTGRDHNDFSLVLARHIFESAAFEFQEARSHRHGEVEVCHALNTVASLDGERSCRRCDHNENDFIVSFRKFHRLFGIGGKRFEFHGSPCSKV